MNNTSDTGNSGRKKLFYGFIVVAACFVVMIMVYGLNYSFGVFFKPLAADFGWSKATTSFAYSLMALFSGIVGIFAGRITDKYGGRAIAIISAIAMGGGFLLLSRLASLWEFYLYYTVLIGMGMGSAWPGLMVVPARWFKARRGLMTGIVASGVGIGTLIFPPIASGLIENNSWSYSYAVLGVVAVVSMGIVAWFIKRDPGKVGQRPFGDESVPLEEKGVPLFTGLTLKEGLRTARFYIACGIYMCFGYCLISILIHIAPHAQEMGISPTIAASIVSVIGGASVVSRVLVAGASDKFGVKATLVFSLTLLPVALVLLQVVNNLTVLYIFAALFGISYGGIMSLQSLVTARLFGLRAVGVLMGVITLLYTIGCAVGPTVTGYIFDVTGSYSLAFWIATGIALLACILAIIIKMPAGEKGIRQ